MLHGTLFQNLKHMYVVFIQLFHSFFFNYMGALSACTSAHQRGVSDVCELPCGCWESNLGPPEEQ